MENPSDSLHELLALALNGKLHTCSPTAIPDKATILDVGTGTGKWACEIARSCSNARVYGIDLHQVNRSDDPPNVVFETVNVMTGFPFNTGTFDFVHSRLLIGGITDWKSYLANLLRITKRGGYVECVEMEIRIGSREAGDSAKIDHWLDRMSSLLQKRALDPSIAINLNIAMDNAGFREITETVLDVPIGNWKQDPREQTIGTLASEYCKTHVVQWLIEALVEQGESETDVVNAADAVLEQITTGNVQPYLRWHFCVGQKAA